jgi:hypothetical protein
MVLGKHGNECRRTAVQVVVDESPLVPGIPRRERDLFLRDARAYVQWGLLTFYIKSADGMELPDIMQWMMNRVHDEQSS